MSRIISARLAFVIFLTMAVSNPGGRADPMVVWSAIELDAKRQRLGGIRVESVERRSFFPKIPVPAQVVDPVPLLETSHRLKQLASERVSQEKIAAILETRLARLEQIGKDLRRDPLEQAQQDWLVAKSRAETLMLEAARLQDRLLAEWGPLLKQWVEAGSGRLAQLAGGGAYLLRLTLPQGDLPRTAALEYQGRLFPLEYLSPAPKTDLGFSGSPHYYLTASSPNLRIGLRLTAWLSEAGEAIPIPRQAVVWHEGIPWIFVKTSPSRFERRPLAAWHETGENFWIEQGVETGEQVVTRGAQLLLAEELKAKLPDEDDTD